MNIKEWYAVAVAAGLMPKDYCIYGESYIDSNLNYGIRLVNHSNDTIFTIEGFSSKPLSTIALRKDGVDLYKLEWRKPTADDDIGKKCWFWNGIGNLGITSSKLYRDWFFETLTGEHLVRSDEGIDYRYCLLADHRQIAPTEEDFMEVFNEN